MLSQIIALNIAALSSLFSLLLLDKIDIEFTALIRSYLFGYARWIDISDFLKFTFNPETFVCGKNWRLFSEHLQSEGIWMLCHKQTLVLAPETEFTDSKQYCTNPADSEYITHLCILK